MTSRLEQFCYTKKDFTLDWYSGTGKGGQHRNKHQNCLRLTHKPSGITVISADSRDRRSNLRVAMERMKDRLKPWIMVQLDDKPPRVTETIRTYNEAKNRVKDHASGEKILYGELDKRFGDLIDARRHTLSKK